MALSYEAADFVKTRWLSKVLDRFFAPKGLEDSAQGFNPGNPEDKRFALKGREASSWMSHLSLRKIECAIETCYNWALLPRC
jgi:hypothetical protein